MIQLSSIYNKEKGGAGKGCSVNSDCISNYYMPMENVEEGGRLTFECV